MILWFKTGFLSRTSLEQMHIGVAVSYLSNEKENRSDSRAGKNGLCSRLGVEWIYGEPMGTSQIVWWRWEDWVILDNPQIVLTGWQSLSCQWSWLEVPSWFGHGTILNLRISPASVPDRFRAESTIGGRLLLGPLGRACAFGGKRHSGGPSCRNS